MSKTVGFIHALPTLVEDFTRLCKEYIPDVSQNHLSVQALHDAEIQEGELNQHGMELLSRSLQAHQDLDASAVVISCSFLSNYVEPLRDHFAIPILRIDEPIITRALETGPRIQILSTVDSSRKSMTQLTRIAAEQRGQTVKINSMTVDGAYDALLLGDLKTHNRLIRDAIEDTHETADVVMLSQASMEHALEDSYMGSERTILTSPTILMETLAAAVTR